MEPRKSTIPIADVLRNTEGNTNEGVTRVFVRPRVVEEPHMMMWTASPQRHDSAKAWSQERHKEGDRP